MTDQPQFAPAPYMARARAVRLETLDGVSLAALKQLIGRSHRLYFQKLPKRRQIELEGADRR